MGWFSKGKTVEEKKPLVGKFGLTIQEIEKTIGVKLYCPENEVGMLQAEIWFSAWQSWKIEYDKLELRLETIENRLNNI